MGLRIAIIGCGYIGTALGQALVNAGHNVTATGAGIARSPQITALGMSHRTLLANDSPGVAALLADCDAVYLTLAAGRKGRSYQDVYLAAARNVAAALPNTPVRRVIYTSSTRVYGQCNGEWVDEDSVTAPTDAEGQTLLAAETTLLAAGGQCAETAESNAIVSVVRLSGIYGPGRDPAQFVTRSAGRVRHDGAAWLNLVHRDDIVTALHRLLDVSHHGVLCFSDDQPVRRQVFYDPLLAEQDLLPVQWRNDPAAGTGKRICNARIKSLLNLKLKYPAHGRATPPA